MNAYDFHGSLRAGEVYLCSIPFGTGHEMLKDRPAVIVSDENFNANNGVVWVVMCSASDHEGRANCVPVSGLDRKSWAICGQFYTVDKSRLIHYITALPPEELEAVRWELRRRLGGQVQVKPLETSREITQAIIERDTYKGLYEGLLDRVLRGGAIYPLFRTTPSFATV